MRPMRWAVAVMGSLSLALGLGVVWCNIERMDLAYDLKDLQEEREDVGSIMTRLEMERNNLLSPHRLRAKAAELGLGPAGRGRLRRLVESRKDAKAPPQE